MAKSMSIKLEFVAPLPQIAITRFTYNMVEFYGPQGPRYKEVDLFCVSCFRLLRKALDKIAEIKAIRENRRLGKRFYSILVSSPEPKAHR